MFHRPQRPTASVQGQHPAFPTLVKHRLVRLRRDRPQPVHAAHVVHAVHGAATVSTPIMALRLTSSARASSDSPSVPAGRRGMTM